MRASRALLLLGAAVIALPAVAVADQASQPGSPAAGQIATGRYHSCTVLFDARTRCWGYAADGALGYGNTDAIGDDETPGSVGPLDLGSGRTATAISAGSVHTCALLDDHTVRCWGYGENGRLGYGNRNSVGASQTAGSVGPVYLGAGRTAKAISAGGAHTCAVLDDGSVRCWGFGYDGRLGYNNTYNVGDVQTPGSVSPVDLGGHKAKAISAGGGHTCALLDDNTLRCWGLGANGQLGYGNTSNVGDGRGQTPASAGPIDLGGHTAKAISAGGFHTCAVLDDGSVRCWGDGGDGQLGYGNTNSIGASQTPGSVGPVNLGAGRTAVAISAGGDHTCALLENGSVRCWGYGAYGQLGYANTQKVGDTPTTTPDTVGPVDLGPGRSAVAISAGGLHTCALLDNNNVRCWGQGVYGQLGYCNTDSVGDDETPGSVGPVNLQPGDGGAGCASPTGTPGSGDRSGTAPPGGGGGGPGTLPGGGHHPVDPLTSQAARAHGLRSCLATAARRPKRQRSRARKACLKRYARTPGRVKVLHARALSSTAVVLSFAAPGSDGPSPPAARGYLVKQSRSPVRSPRDFRRAQTLCHADCRFAVTTIGARITLTITHLTPHSTYYYAITARDNVSGRPGPRSPTAQIRTL